MGQYVNFNALHDFRDGRGLVPARQHPSGGGWVAQSACVMDGAYIGPDAEVFGTAIVHDGAVVTDFARVNNVRIHHGVWVGARAEVQGPDDILSGFAGMHAWSAFRTRTNRTDNVGVWFQYGCESHALEWWMALNAEGFARLSVKHGHPPEHARFTRGLVALVQGVLL